MQKPQQEAVTSCWSTSSARAFKTAERRRCRKKRRCGRIAAAKPEIEHIRKELEHAKQAVRKLSVAEAQRKLSGSDSIGHPIMDVQSVITQ